MENKSTKIFTSLLIILIIAFIGASAYLMRDQDEKPLTIRTGPETVLTDLSPETTAVKPLTHNEPANDHYLKPEDEAPAQTIARQEKPEPRQMPRHLTEEQKQENLREIAKMAEALPDNMWVPKAPTPGYSPERGETLRKSIELSDKIRKNTASADEQREYYTFKLKEVTDKIELIRYIANRTEELSTLNNKAYLTASDINTGEERIEELKQLAGEFEQKLSQINPLSGQ
jgi:hypothetical protein